MRTAFDTTIRVDHPPERVWAALTDWPRLGEWMPGVVAATGPAHPSAGEWLTLSMTHPMIAGEQATPEKIVEVVLYGIGRGEGSGT